MGYKEIKAKAEADLDEARKIIDEVDTAADMLTGNGAVLPPPFGIVLKVLDAVRKVVDVLDGVIGPDPQDQATPPAAIPARVEPYDPTKSPGA